MSINPRRKKGIKGKFAAYVLLLAVLWIGAFFLNRFFILQKPLFISPLSRINVDLALVEKKLKDNKILFSKISLSDYSYLVEIQNNGQIRFSQKKDIDKQIASLQRILIQLTIEGKPFKSIDFRFSDPVISFK